jgi:hypothetical protein
MSIVGALILPMWTGSLIRFIKHPVEEEYVFDHSNADESCDAAHYAGYPPSEYCAKLQHDSAPIGSYYATQATLDTERAIFVVRDLVIGLLVPTFLVLILPPIVRRYLCWLTS